MHTRQKASAAGLLNETFPRTLFSYHSAINNLLHHNGIESNAFKQFVDSSHYIRDGSFRGQRMVSTSDWQC